MPYNCSNSFSSINYEAILKLMEEAKNLAVKGPREMRFEQGRNRRLLSHHRLLKKIAKMVITPILGSLGLELRTTEVKDASAKYVVSRLEKAWSLDFLLYALREKPELDLELFDHRDRREVIKLVRKRSTRHCSANCMPAIYSMKMTSGYGGPTMRSLGG